MTSLLSNIRKKYLRFWLAEFHGMYSISSERYLVVLRAMAVLMIFALGRITKRFKISGYLDNGDNDVFLAGAGWRALVMYNGPASCKVSIGVIFSEFGQTA